MVDTNSDLRTDILTAFAIVSGYLNLIGSGISTGIAMTLVQLKYKSSITSVKGKQTMLSHLMLEKHNL